MLNWFARHSGVREPSSGADDLRSLGDSGSGGASVDSEVSLVEASPVLGRNLAGKARREMDLEGVLACFLLLLAGDAVGGAATSSGAFDMAES